jgi:hypothetical protein
VSPVQAASGIVRRVTSRLPHVATAPAAFAALVVACAAGFLVDTGRLPLWALAFVVLCAAAGVAGLARVVAASEHAEPVWWARFEADFRAYAAESPFPA